MAEVFAITGGARLVGETRVSGSKNAASAILPAMLLCDEPCYVDNLSDIEDVHVLCKLMQELGAIVKPSPGGLYVDPRPLHTFVCTDPIACNLRATSYFLGVLLSRMGRVELALPGGCDLGTRAFDLHIKGLQQMGAQLAYNEQGFTGVTPGLHGAEVYLDRASVGATINLMLAATKAQGNTIITNAAREPHVVDVANFINSMGGNIKGAGTSAIRIRGAQRLHESSYTIIPDQIETGTLMLMAAATRGNVLISGAIPAHMEAVTAKLLEMGARVEEGDDMIRVSSTGAHRHVNVKTLEYPGFPTDLQQPISAMLTTARGTSVIIENIFDDRLKQMHELARMGAVSSVQENVATIEGADYLTGTDVYATDLRCGAALVLAGMMARGTTTVHNIHYIDRGYEHLDEKLRALGASIERRTL